MLVLWFSDGQLYTCSTVRKSWYDKWWGVYMLDRCIHLYFGLNFSAFVSGSSVAIICVTIVKLLSSVQINIYLYLKNKKRNAWVIVLLFFFINTKSKKWNKCPYCHMKSLVQQFEGKSPHVLSSHLLWDYSLITMLELFNSGFHTRFWPWLFKVLHPSSPWLALICFSAASTLVINIWCHLR